MPHDTVNKVMSFPLDRVWKVARGTEVDLQGHQMGCQIGVEVLWQLPTGKIGCGMCRRDVTRLSEMGGIPDAETPGLER